MGLSPRWFLGGGFTAIMWLTGSTQQMAAASSCLPALPPPRSPPSLSVSAPVLLPSHFSLRAIVTLGSCALALFIYVLWAYQESLLYQPRVFPQYTRPQDNPAGYRNPGEQGMPYEDVWLDTEDGCHLHAWWVRPADESERRRRATLIFFHANAGNMGFRLDNIRQMLSELQLNVFILSYRGYGNSTGTPTEKGILVDAETTWRHVSSRADVDPQRIVVFGRSLGGSVAIALASKHCRPPADAATATVPPSCISARDALAPSAPPAPPPYVAGLIVENTFTSISALVNTLFPLLSPLKPLILRLEWPAITRIASVTCPLLLLSGQLDEVVPCLHMQQLFDAAVNSSNRTIHKVAKGLHNNTWSEGGEHYTKAIKTFLHDAVGTPQPTLAADAVLTTADAERRQQQEAETAPAAAADGLRQRM